MQQKQWLPVLIIHDKIGNILYLEFDMFQTNAGMSIHLHILHAKLKELSS